MPRQQRAAWAVAVLASLGPPEACPPMLLLAGLLGAWVAGHQWVPGCSCMHGLQRCLGTARHAPEQKQAAIQSSTPEFV